jgi:hypothetical protein
LLIVIADINFTQKCLIWIVYGYLKVMRDTSKRSLKSHTD